MCSLTGVPPGAEVARTLRSVRRLMGSGLLISLFGNAVMGGVLPAGIAIGALSIVWLPLLRTIEGLEDLLSPIVARLLNGRDAGRTLAICEGVDAVASLCALCAIAVSADHEFTIAAVYILIVTPIPLFVDVAEELFAGELAKHGAGEALAFNTVVYSIIGLSSGLIATPIGSLLASRALPVAVAINLGVSILAVLLRSLAVRSLAARPMADEFRAGSRRDSEKGRFDAQQRQRLHTVLAASGPGSPLISGLLAASSAIVGGYLVQWAARLHAHPASTVTGLLVCVGAGAAVGPQLARNLARWGFSSAARRLLEIRVAGLLGVLVLSRAGHRSPEWTLVVVGVLIVGISIASSGSPMIQATARQVEFSADRLAQIVGWSHSMAAAGAIVGVWLGLILTVQRAPAAGVGVSGVIAAGAWVMLRRADSGPSA